MIDAPHDMDLSESAAAEGIADYDQGDYGTAFLKLLPLAKDGVAEAQHYLGLMCFSGQGTEASAEEAAGWYRQAAERGFAPSQFNLGNMYLAGQGVERDHVEAIAWYRQAANHNLPAATYNLGVLHATGDGVPQSMDKATEFYRQAAEAGYAEAQANLGVFYASGTGVDKADFVEAYAWFKLAADQGNEPARRNLTTAAEHMTSDQVAEADSRAAALRMLAQTDRPPGYRSIPG